MLSNEIETVFEDGEWITKTRAAVIFEVSERTIENRIKTGVYHSKVDEGKTLVFVKSSKLNPMGRENLPSIAKPIESLPRPYEVSSKVCETCETLREQIETLRNQLSNEREAHAKLQGEMKGKDDLLVERSQRLEDIRADKDETIQAQKGTINANNAAIMLSEQLRPALPAATEPEKLGWLARLIGKQPNP